MSQYNPIVNDTDNYSEFNTDYKAKFSDSICTSNQVNDNINIIT